MQKLEEILSDPSAAFASPVDVVGNPDIPRSDKIRILRQWRYDLVQLQVASGENLTGDSSHAAGISRIDEYLRQLQADSAQG
jgi:hypothetical protein